jgi:hypothetical protein
MRLKDTWLWPKGISRPASTIGLAIFLVLVLTLFLHASQTITITTPAANTVSVRIDQPTVTQSVTQYPTIVFRPGDTVTVNAGGCVQTGGSGKTWKRYVNPSGPNSDHLYFGEIMIPGATLEMVRVSTLIGKTLTVPANVDLPGQLFLKLGYADDNYGDNGYWGHDDGTENQCEGTAGDNAWVTLTIVHGGTPPPPDPEHPYDLVWTEADGNNFPFNARWTAQTPAPGQLPGQAMCGYAWEAPCTTQAPSTHVGKLCAIGKAVGQAGELGGHANWGVATYDGYASWDGHSSPATDDDYNVNVTRTDEAFYTSDNPNNVHTEFDSDETIDHFHTSWWDAFHGAVDNSDNAARQYIDGKYIVEMGVAGLDCAHSCGSEIHPVFAFALHIDDNAAADGWAIFARNSGDEGFCGDEELGIDVSAVTITIPWRPGATGVTVKDATEFLTNSTKVSGPVVTPTPGQSVNITFNLPAPEDGARVNGVLYLTWTGAPTVAIPRAPIAVARIFKTAIPATLQKQTEPEDQVNSLVAGMSAELQKEYAATTPPKDTTKDSIALHVTMKAPPAAVAHPPVVAHAMIEMHTSAAATLSKSAVQAAGVKKLPPVRAFPNPQKAALDQKRIAILQKAYPHLAQ